jgi:hypothetical protein
MSSNPAPRPAAALAEGEDESSQIRRLPSDLPSRFRRGKQRAARERAARQAALSRPTVPDLAPYRDTIPSPAPAPESFRPTDLERTLRFAKLVRDTLAPQQSVALGSRESMVRLGSLGQEASRPAHTIQLLDMAIARRDAALLRAILKYLHDDQQRARAELELQSAADLNEPEEDPAVRSTRHTILPPPPNPAANTGTGKTRR